MLSVVCPIYNEERYIRSCIESILSQDYPREGLEVLFVDGMSTDRTREIVAEYACRYPFIRLIDNPRKIVPCAMNIGIRASRGEVIVRLDAHAIFPTNYFSELVRSLDELKADNVGGVCLTLPMNDTPVCRGITNVLSSGFGVGNSYFRIGARDIIAVDTVPFGCFRRDIFDRIGYFDEELTRNQDDEFNGRIVKNGGKIYLLPHLAIKYYARDSIRKVWKMYYQYGLFKPLVNKKLGRPATIRQFFPPCFVLGVVLGPVLGFLSPWFWIAYLAVILCYFALATGFSLRYSKKWKDVVLQDCIYFVAHFSYGAGYLAGLMKLLFRRPFHVQVNR